MFLLFFFLLRRPPPRSTLFPYTTLFRSMSGQVMVLPGDAKVPEADRKIDAARSQLAAVRSEEHTSELQSRFDLVCRLLLEKKKQNSRALSVFALSSDVLAGVSLDYLDAI